MKELIYYFTYSIIGIFSLAVIGGVLFHILMQLMRIISYFTYSGLFFLEPIVKLELYVPEKGYRRLIMDSCATILFGISIQAITLFFKNPNDTFIYDLPNKIPFFYAITGIICLSLIYYLGYKSKPNDSEQDEWFDKQKNLSIPKFLKFWE